MNKKSNYDYKIVLIGSSNVGKTTFMHRKKYKRFNPYIESTIGACYYCSDEKVDNKQVTVHMWDTAGQERYDSLAPLYYKNADCIYLMFDLQDEMSLRKAKQWFDEIKYYEHFHEKQFLLIGTKLDLDKKRNVYMKDIDRLFHKRVEYIEISSKDNINLDIVDNLMFENIKTYMKKPKITKKDNEEITKKNVERYKLSYVACCPTM